VKNIVAGVIIENNRRKSGFRAAKMAKIEEARMVSKSGGNRKW